MDEKWPPDLELCDTISYDETRTNNCISSRNNIVTIRQTYLQTSSNRNVFGKRIYSSILVTRDFDREYPVTLIILRSQYC